ncbi:MAG: membrane protein insertase YidC [Verrucomicrobiae bacterium]|nr:membrane protein insertase YidC [Verrucomicrobiae bacterium]
MDRKGFLILAGALALMLSWSWLVNRLYPPVPRPPGMTNAPGMAAPGPATPSSAASAGSPQLSPAGADPAVVATPLVPLAELSAAPGPVLTLENAQVRATITALGGGLRSVDLKEYPASVGCRQDDRAMASEPASLNDPAFLPAFVHQDSAELGAGVTYTLSERDGVVRATRSLTNGLRLTKEFRIASNYVFAVTLRWENTGTAPVAIPARELVIGTASSGDRTETSEWLGAHWFNGADTTVVNEGWFANRTLGCLPGTPRSEYVAGASNVVWGAANNRFFTMITVPESPADRIVVRDFALPKPAPSELEANGRLNPNPRALQTALLLPPPVLAPGASLEQQFSLYAGPKEYFTLSRMGNNLEAVMDLTGFTGFFAKGLLLSLNGLHQFIPSYGWSIIALTVIIKGLFWPLTALSTRSMKRMQAIQPELQAIREKYKSDPKRMQEKTMECMKRHKVNPAAGCLPMLIQFPVFIGFFFMLRTAIELRGAEFLWVCNLSAPDTLFMIPGLGWLPFLGVAGVGLPFNLLPLLMGATSLWMAHLTPMSPQMDPAQQKIMRYMPVFFVLFLYNYSSGLTLYWTAQNLLTVFQTKLTKMNDAKSTPQPAPKPSAPRKP